MIVSESWFMFVTSALVTKFFISRCLFSPQGSKQENSFKTFLMSLTQMLLLICRAAEMCLMCGTFNAAHTHELGLQSAPVSCFTWLHHSLQSRDRRATPDSCLHFYGFSEIWCKPGLKSHFTAI